MNSEFPMTFVDSDERSESKRLQSSGSLTQPHKARSADKTEAKREASRKVIPMSHVSLAGLSDNAAASNPSAPRRALYPMSEFDDLDGKSSTQNYQRSPLKLLLRLSLLATLGGLWGAIGLGRLHSDVAFVAETRAALVANVPALAGLLKISTEAQSEFAQDDVPVHAGEVSSDVPDEADALVQNEAENLFSVSESNDSAQENEALVELAQANAGVNDQSAIESRATMNQGLELATMLELFLEQGRQMQKMESHMIELVRKNGNQEQLNQFLTELRKRHQSAIQMTER